MSSATGVEVGIDPYRMWLNIRVDHRPLNPYELLTLKLMENDQARIRMAANRMRTLLEMKQPKAPPELWQQVWDEVQQAESLLLDLEQRRMLDAGLKRKMTTSPPAAMLKQEEAHGGLAHGIVCKGCQCENPASRRFCGDCGKPLWEKCPTCATEIPGNERFCGQCGTDVNGFLQEKQRELASSFQQAEAFMEACEFAKGISVLRGIASVEDPRLAEWAERAIEAIANADEDWKRVKQGAEEKVQQGKKLLAGNAYEKVIALLSEIAEPLLSVEGHKVLGEAKQKREELQTLGGEIRQALAEERIWDFFPKIERLLALKPNHPQVPTLVEDVRKRIFRKAKKKVKERSYGEALEIIEHIPAFAETAEVKELKQTVVEMATLTQHVRQAPWVDDSTLRLAKRLAEYDTEDQELAELLAKIVSAGKEGMKDRHYGAPTFAMQGRKMPLGKPVEWLARSTSLKQFEGMSGKEELETHLGEYWLAMGLALQGIGQAKVDVNLLPAEKQKSVWGRLTATFVKREAQGAWGIDVGEYAIKAIRLATDAKGEQVQVTHCVYVAHATPLVQLSGEAEKGAMLLESLKALRAKIEPGKDRICGAMPGMQVLGRFFELPPMASKKVAEAVKFELQHQIPIASAELSWGYVSTDQAPIATVKKGSEDVVPRRIVLVATRQAHVLTRTGLFEAAGLPLDILQSGCLALHNALGCEMPSESAPQAMVDMGASGTSVVISGANGVWFRTFGVGSENTVGQVAKELRLTSEQARKLLRQPHLAKRLSPLEEVVLPLHGQLTGEVERSVMTGSKSLGVAGPARIWGLGGGVGCHALVRRMTHGK